MPNAYWLTWNPSISRFNQSQFETGYHQIRNGSEFTTYWGIGGRQTMEVGSRIFVFRVGKGNITGIVASGFTTSEARPTKPHSPKAKREIVYVVDVSFDHMTGVFEHEALITLEDIRSIYGSPKKALQGNFNTIPPAYLKIIEEKWAELNDLPLLQAVSGSFSYTEGRKKLAIQNFYERNPLARQLCLLHHGAICKVCNLKFEDRYSGLGKGYIHVHHLTPIHSIGKEYRVDPVNDLVPVCPNCHAMLHKKAGDQPYTIEELKKLYRHN